MTKWEELFDAAARTHYSGSDPSHDYLHIRRVVRTALRLARAESADPMVVLPAAYFHDFVTVPKNDSRRSQASSLSADAAVGHLRESGYPEEYLGAIHHAIVAHSFSAGIACETVEAAVVQDADRLDSLGAIGIARCFTTGALMGTSYYDEADPFGESRTLSDRRYSVDHFFVKLFKVAETLQTKAAREEGARRAEFMRTYLHQLRGETGV